jgi:predicted ArsR family transcriptional regulator
MAKKKTAKKRDHASNPGEKASLLLSMLKAKGGATVEEMTKSLGWLPHTLRARISTLAKEKKLKIERTRNEGVTTYRVAA